MDMDTKLLPSLLILDLATFILMHFNEIPVCDIPSNLFSKAPSTPWRLRVAISMEVLSLLP
jgi:hypothetical protein